jgi:uncharacterized protein (TIGR02598 family)
MNAKRRNHGAFSLVEVTIALGIMAFCMVAIFGLLPTGYSSNQAAIEQTTAATIASALISDIRQAPQTVSGSGAEPQSPHYLIGVPVQTGTSVISETHTLFLTQDGAVAAANAATTSAQDENIDRTQEPRFRATMVFTVPALGPAPSNAATGQTSAANHAATMLRLLITWPAVADPKGGILPTSQSFSFETMVALDRN